MVLLGNLVYVALLEAVAHLGRTVHQASQDREAHEVLQGLTGPLEQLVI